MLAWGDREACRRSLYSGTAALRLCRLPCGLCRCGRRALRGSRLPAAPIGSHSLFARTTADADADRLHQPPGRSTIAASAQRPARPIADLAYARAAASDVLARGGKDNSVPWENPHTGAGGNITPLATAYTEGGLSCRDFLASYVHGGSQDWLQGAACRTEPRHLGSQEPQAPQAV